jgi:protein-tyrosine phosphatase
MTTSVVRVQVEPTDGGGAEVAWQLEGEDTGVEVAVGATDAHHEHRSVSTVAAGTTSAHLDRVPEGRFYVSVRPLGAGAGLVGSPRRLAVDGMQNFRDLGGYRTAGGGHTRWGCVFRADSPHKLTPEGRTAVDELGIAVVYDLRGDRERATHPSPLTSIHLPVVGRASRTSGDAVVDDALDASMLEATSGEQVLRDTYVGSLERSADLFGTLLGGLTEPGGLPAVFHCHAGKDRTGVVAMLLLRALGVDRETILDDYELTRRYRLREHQNDTVDSMLARGMSPTVIEGLLGTPRWAMADAIDEVETVYGGIEAYLTGPAGLTPDRLARLRELLVVPAPQR